MSDLVLIGALAEATGHPTECTEPAPGTVQSTSTCNVTLNGVPLATRDTADIHFDAHAHTYDGTCTDSQSHDIDPDSARLSDSITYNGSPMYLVDNPVTSDPTSGGDVNITDTGGNTSLTET